MLWDCKREALRGLGVNTGEGRKQSTATNFLFSRVQIWSANITSLKRSDQVCSAGAVRKLSETPETVAGISLRFYGW